MPYEIEEYMKVVSLTSKSAIGLCLLTIVPFCKANFLDDLFGSVTQEPIELATTTQQIFNSNPVWVLDGNQTSAWKVVTGPKPKKGSAKLELNQINGDIGLIPAQMNAGSIARNTGKVPLNKPISVEFLKNGAMQLNYGEGKKAVEVDVALKAYDVSGLPIANFLKNRDGSVNPMAERMGSTRFPKGSIAYRAQTTFVNDEMVLPVNEKFTSAKSNKELIENFSDIPFCLNRTKGHSYGISFAKSNAGAKSGSFKVVPVQRDTMFCRPTGEPAVATGSWNAISTGNSSAVVLTMPKEVDPSEYGFDAYESGVTKFAFVAPSKGDKVFRPGKYYKKGTTVISQRYFFNPVAAQAIIKQGL